MPEEGKSITAANLAVVFAQANFKTIIVDADIRHSVLHQVFGVKSEFGLGDMLDSPESKLEDYLKDTQISNLQILTSGKPLLDPSDRLGSKRMKGIIADLHNIADIVVVDSPPILLFADATILSRRLDGVIVVTRAGKSKQSAVDKALIDLRNANANLLGGVFNQSPQSDTLRMTKAYMQERMPLPASESLNRASVD